MRYDQHESQASTMCTNYIIKTTPRTVLPTTSVKSAMAHADASIFSMNRRSTRTASATSTTITTTTTALTRELGERVRPDRERVCEPGLRVVRHQGHGLKIAPHKNRDPYIRANLHDQPSRPRTPTRPARPTHRSTPAPGKCGLFFLTTGLQLHSPFVFSFIQHKHFWHVPESFSSLRTRAPILHLL